MQNTRQSSIQGTNFTGNAKLTQDKLALDIINFKNMKYYTLQILNEEMAKEPNMFIAFDNVQDLFEELLTNQNMEVSDEHILLIPIAFTYKENKCKKRIQMRLKIAESYSEEEIKIKLFKQIEIMKKQKGKITSSMNDVCFPIKFRLNPMKNINHAFDIKSKTIRKLKIEEQNIFKHNECLPTKGRYFFQFKVTKSQSQNVFFGVCSRTIKQNKQQNNLNQIACMGYLPRNGIIYKNRQFYDTVDNPQFQIGRSVIRLEIDMYSKRLLWIMDGKLVKSAPFGKNLLGVQIFPMIRLLEVGDTIEMLSDWQLN